MLRLKELRTDKGLTLKAVAEYLNMGQRNYQRYENGEVDPPLSKAIALADLFDCSLDYLCGRSDVKERR